MTIEGRVNIQYVAEPHEIAPIPLARSGGFNDSVGAILADTEYRRANSGEELDAIYRLRYLSYRASGLVNDIESKSFSDEYDRKPNCFKFSVYINEDIVATLRVHHLTKEMPFSPAMSVFPDVLGPRLEAGDTFVDPSRLAADPNWTSIVSQIPFITLRLAVAATEFFKATSCLAMVRDDHIAFYRRYFHAVRIAEPRVYPSVTVLGHLFESSRLLNMQRTLERFSFFRSTALERRLLFSHFENFSDTPLTIRPMIGVESVES